MASTKSTLACCLAMLALSSTVGTAAASSGVTWSFRGPAVMDSRVDGETTDNSWPAASSGVSDSPIGELTCAFCERLVGWARAGIRTGHSKEEIVAAGPHFCDPVVILHGQCLSKVSEDLPTIVDNLLADVDWWQICDQMSRCDASEDACSFCHVLVQYAHVGVSKGSSKSDIVSAAPGDICPSSPVSSSQCHSSIREYLPTIVDKVSAGTDDDTICKKLDACDDDDDNNNNDVVSNRASATASATGPATTSPSSAANAEAACTFCLAIAKFTETSIAQGVSDDDIRSSAVDSICPDADLPGFVCRAKIAQYLPRIIKYTHEGHSQRAICSHLDACRSSVFRQPELFSDNAVTNFGDAASSVFNGFMCGVCGSLVDVVKAGVDSSKSKDTITHDAEKICSPLGPVKGLCKSAVDAAVPKVIDMLAQKMGSEQICHAIGFC